MDVSIVRPVSVNLDQSIQHERIQRLSRDAGFVAFTPSFDCGCVYWDATGDKPSALELKGLAELLCASWFHDV
jgi:hypothetical protein